MSLRSQHLAPPSTSLPPLRQTGALTASTIAHALRNLQGLYSPLPQPLDFQPHAKHEGDTAAADSGYASGDDEDAARDRADALRRDPLERHLAERWLTGFLGRAEELGLDEAVCEQLVDDACHVLACLTRGEEVGLEVEVEGADVGMKREFAFALRGDAEAMVRAALHDTPMQMGEDHTDVGLQTWGASVVLSDLICHAPERFRLEAPSLDSQSRIVELGAGTGLVSLVLASLLPRTTASQPMVIATDYHPTVLANLETNISVHKATDQTAAPLQACLLDWSSPSREPPLDIPADRLIAADVVYAPEHAVWLRDCAGRLLAPAGVFWLMVSVRPNGKFEAVSDTVELAFSKTEECPVAEDGRRLSILGMEHVKYRRGVGRADEVGYKLFEIGWA